MLKRVLGRACMGFMMGAFLGQVTQIILSFLIGNGKFLPVLDGFVKLFHTEFLAVFIQFLLTGLIGVALALGSFIFEVERWGMMKQYVTHFFSTGVVWFTVVILCWTPRTSVGWIILLVNFVGVYVITYWIQLSITRKDIEQINAVLQTKVIGGS